MKKKKIMALFFSILFTFLFMMPVYAQEQANEPIKLFYANKEIHFTAPPIQEGDILMVPLSEMMKVLGADVYEIVPQSKYAVVKENRQYHFTVGDSSVIRYEKDGTFIDSNKIDCTPAPKLINNVVYVPISFPRMIVNFTHYVNYIPEANMVFMDCFISEPKPNMELMTESPNKPIQNNGMQNNTIQNNTVQQTQTTTSGAIQFNGIQMKEYKKDMHTIPEWIHEDELRQYTSISIGPAGDGNNGMEIYTTQPKYQRLLYFQMPKSLRGWTPKAEMEIEISVDGVRMKVIKSPYSPTRYKLNSDDLMAKGWISEEKDGVVVEDNSATKDLDAQIESWMKNNPGAFDF